ncbi:MAG TPA: efflux RND transporter permease subunit [Saprospiraceae bacterium]|nr:efflux RND transporter permease subunit [Saprospiraceae bacterium]
MSLSEISIKRPVLATVMSIVIVLFGIIGFFYLGIRDYPSVDPPVITVSTTYTGANSDVIISQITEPLEESINGIDGIKVITSNSSDGRSTITVEFDLDVDLETAANDVRDRVSRAQRNLPVDANPPIVSKSDATAQPILSLTVQSDQRTLLELSEIGNNLFKERFQTIPGVSSVNIWGEKRYSMKLVMDPSRMAAHGITPVDVRNALSNANVELPSGRLEGKDTELTIRTVGRIETVDEFNNLIIRENNGSVIRFKDVGTAEMRPENERSLLRGNGAIPMIGVAVTPQPGANYVAIADEFFKRLENIKKELPGDLKLGLALDTTKGIKNAIVEVEETIFIAFGLVVLVIFLFLRNWRSTLIPVVAIPISLISAFFIMYLAGFSINILTLLGIVLATGLVVDDAIVVLENIYQKIEQGMSPREAAFKGSEEIFFAIVSTTITLVAVFLPIMFLQGLTGRLFREFGVVVAGAVFVSAFVSLTLTPMMSSRLLRAGDHERGFYKWSEGFFVGMTNMYSKGLNWFFRIRWVAIIIMIISFWMMYQLGKSLPSELAPMEDKSRLSVNATAPEGTSFEFMNDFLTKVIKDVEQIPEKESILSVTAPGFGASQASNTGFVRISLVEPDQRTKSQMEIADELSKTIKKYSEARVFVNQEQTIGDRRGGLPVQFVIMAPNFELLKKVIPTFLEKARASEKFQAVDINLKFNKPELKIDIDRNRAQALGVSVMDIAQTLQLYYAEQRLGFFIKNGKQYQVIGMANKESANEPFDLKGIYVRSNKGQLVQLDNLITMSEQSNPPQLYRFNRYVSATVSAGTSNGVSLGQGIDAMKDIAKEVLTDQYTTDLSGPSKEFEESSSTLLFAFILALLLVYLILAAQFESFKDPLIIMLTVPLALAGAILALWYTDSTLNIFSQIGIIVLIGIVTKNGILIVEFANQRKEDGLNTVNAVKEAAISRLRPILMTSLATVLGALPIAMAFGAASLSRVSMGIAIIGGLMFSLILTLFVIPALYTYMSGHTKSLE